MTPEDIVVLVVFICLSCDQIIPPRSLSFLRQIGSGQFGEVHVGRLRLKDRKHGGVATNDLVAIKLMKGKNLLNIVVNIIVNLILTPQPQC